MLLPIEDDRSNVGDDDDDNDVAGGLGITVGLRANVVELLFLMGVCLERGSFGGLPALRFIGCSGGGSVGCWKGKFVLSMSGW